MPTQPLILVPPKIQAMMTGAVMASINGTRRGPKVTLTYSDGTKESAIVDLSISERDNWFAIVRKVQEQRKAA